MRIKLFARSFFEARMGTRREAELFRRYRIISINNISFPAEPPPFSPQFRDADNLLVLFFDDVETEFSNAMTTLDAEKIISFVRPPDTRPLLIHCSAGISRSGAVGEVLNWYYNRNIPNEFHQFYEDNPDIQANEHVKRVLWEVINRMDTI